MNTTKNRKNREKTVGILVLVAVLLFSTTAVTAKTELTTSHKLNIQPNGHHTHRDLLWDNGNYTTNALSSQLDLQYPFNSQVADDFKFSSYMTIAEVVCFGLFWNGNPINPIDLNVIFYADDGTGTMPTGAGMQDPTSTALRAETHTQVMGGDNGDGTYTYDIILNAPFIAKANTKYWIAFQWVGNYPPQWGWCISDSQQLHDCMSGFPLLGYPYWTDPGYGDVAFQFIPYDLFIPDVDCQGTLTWSNVKPGATVNGSFQVGNVGDYMSYLDWQVSSWPSWGTWTFTPNSGAGLAKGDWTTVTVSVVAPSDKQTSFNGTVRVVNTDNTSDFADIPVTLTTPLNQGLHDQSFFGRFFMRFPHAFPILRYLIER
jgi:hypothetical protein